jgi:hypothetical protein
LIAKTLSSPRENNELNAETMEMTMIKGDKFD